MKIGYFADGEWSHKALDKIIKNDSFKVDFIVARHDKADPILKIYAERLNVPFLTTPDVNGPEFISRIAEFGSDIFVSMSFNQILKKTIIELPPKRFINCHAGKLPFYRGRNILNWALINGEKEFGVTVHYVDEGIDTGDIILQNTYEIEPHDNYGTLLRKAIEACPNTLEEALNIIHMDKVNPISQKDIHPRGFYCSQRRDGDEWIDWSWSSERIYNFIRGITIPGPCARSVWGDKKIAVICAEMIPDAPNYIDCPGRIVGRDDNGVTVKTGDTSLKVTEIADLEENGHLSNQRCPKLRMGGELLGKTEVFLKKHNISIG